MHVNLRKVTADNVWDIINLSTAPEQNKFVAPNAVSLAQARFNDKAWPRGIYCDDQPVGFIMLYQNPEGKEPAYFIWRLMIGNEYQGKGYGKRAVELAIEHVKNIPGAYRLGVSYVPGPGCPENFYRKLGFVPTGEEDEGEVEMLLTWAEAPPQRPDITLRPVTADNMRAVIQLKVGKDQENHVTANLDSIAEAFVYPHLKLWGIYLAEDPVGFIMLEEDSSKDMYFLWRLMVDKEHQGKGYGKHAMEALIQYLLRRTDALELRTSCSPGPDGPLGFYHSLGFRENDAKLDDEVVITLPLLHR